GLIIIAANAGGAFSPIGDVTTTMLWIGNKVSTGKLFLYLFIPSLLCMLVPSFIASFLKPFQGTIDTQEDQDTSLGQKEKHSATMLYLGLGAIVFVPIFKTVTHLPPYVGMMLSLAVVATFAEIFSRRKFLLTDFNAIEESTAHAYHSPVHSSLSKIEMPSILFFLGILMAVAALESLGILFGFADTLKESIPLLGTELQGTKVSDSVVMLLGLGSAVIDNVPLVAASLGMFTESLDNPLWHFIAFSAGTGGSMLIIGSAAGVVAMGMEKIDFFWYLKKISWLALLGFLVGSFSFMIMRSFI
ncbi:MAG: sodium:proton antiporter NhaD, partial [Flavobacteriaceae bacterium]|nr:sodium:proton antiporter NhaD [Flavobacteriaceae bacterium]